MTIQLGRKPPEETFITPQRPSRKNDIARFWAPQKMDFAPAALPFVKTPQPQRKMVTFWETKSASMTSSMKTTTSKSMSSLNQPEVDVNRGYTPSDVAKDPVKREFLTNLSKKIFSPPADSTKRLSRHGPVSRSFRVCISQGLPPPPPSFSPS